MIRGPGHARDGARFDRGVRAFGALTGTHERGMTGLLGDVQLRRGIIVAGLDSDAVRGGKEKLGKDGGGRCDGQDYRALLQKLASRDILLRLRRKTSQATAHREPLLGGILTRLLERCLCVPAKSH